jgi:hypothetical protein
MTKPKIIYVHPGDLLDIRIIRDPEELKDRQSWEYQVRPGRILMQVKRDDYVSVSNPDRLHVDGNIVDPKTLIAVSEL